MFCFEGKHATELQTIKIAANSLTIKNKKGNHEELEIFTLSIFLNQRHKYILLFLFES